jgi:DNA replicative helicase MCM subunit Mcm2 (Cdc46/Mcm family)
LNVKDINIKTWENRIKKDWDVFLPEMGYPENMDFVKDQKVKQTMNNIMRLAQANARGEARAVITEKDLEEARNMFTNSAEELVSHPITTEAKRNVVKQKEHNRVQSIKILLDQGTSTIDEMWEQLKVTGYYTSKQDFEDLITWLHKKGIIYQPNTGYSWL